VEDDVVLTAPLFANMDPEASRTLLASMAPLHVARGEVLFHEGEPGDRLYVIRSGKIKLGRRSTDGRENLLAVLGPGEMFGELSLFDPGPRTATATGLADAVVLELGHHDLIPWLEQNPTVAKHQLVGASRETVNKALADFAARGWVRREGRAIVLLDLERLERRAR
jgi:CRP-like cAMP-binding protein